LIDTGMPENVERLIEAIMKTGVSIEQVQSVILTHEHPPTVKIDRAVEDGERMLMYGGIRIIHTPGYSAGHICQYLERSKTLVAANELMIVQGKLHNPVPQTSLDIEQSYRSIHKLIWNESSAITAGLGFDFRILARYVLAAPLLRDGGDEWNPYP
jgi:glyoxylase-like metal-dependent hydrolase (beta-lactamase superfamily II)